MSQEHSGTPQPAATRAQFWKTERLQWLADEIDRLTSEIEIRSPSELAESVRYLPEFNSPMPGPFRFDVCPYMREPVDCMSAESPIRELAIMKGVQLCITTALLENAALYDIVHLKTVPVMFATATLELAKARLEGFILPMLQQSKLGHLIKSSDDQSSQKKGKTKDRIEWEGGGRMNLIGANSASGMRSLPVCRLYRDEIDTWPDVTGKDGDPLELTKARTKTFEVSRKILDISTPLLRGTSKIEKQFLRGDQRHYFVCCLGCGAPQTFSSHRRDPEQGLFGWRRVDPDTGEVSGFVWDLDDNGKLVPGSVKWLCNYCGHEHVNEDKTRLLSPEHGAEWRPTATPEAPSVRSYHISAFYSPVGMQSWEACVRDWLLAWNPLKNEVRDPAKLQVFYNNILGETFQADGEKLKPEQVSRHRRGVYRSGEIPNRWAGDHAGSPVLFVVCTVDVHKANLAVATWGWCRGGRVLLLNYDRYEGNCEDPEDSPTWGRLTDTFESTEYKADDGKRYRIEMALVDSRYQPAIVHSFCSKFGGNVFPIQGVSLTANQRHPKHFTESTNRFGNTVYSVTVDLYKDRWAAALRRKWDPQGLQPSPFFNAPANLGDDQLKELTVEYRAPIKNQRTGEIVAWSWVRPSGAKNELWDLLVYANAAHDIILHGVCKDDLGIEDIDDAAQEAFWDVCLSHRIFFYE